MTFSSKTYKLYRLIIKAISFYHYELCIIIKGLRPKIWGYCLGLNNIETLIDKFLAHFEIYFKLIWPKKLGTVSIYDKK